MNDTATTDKPKALNYHAVLKDGTVVSAHTKGEFSEKIAGHPPESIALAVQGRQLTPKVTLSF